MATSQLIVKRRRVEWIRTGRTVERPTTQARPMSSAAARRFAIPLARNPARGRANRLGRLLVVIPNVEEGEEDRPLPLPFPLACPLPLAPLESCSLGVAEKRGSCAAIEAWVGRKRTSSLEH